jgi:hypothetical protein
VSRVTIVSMAAFDQVAFDFSLEEAVDFQIAFVRTTREGKSWRTREQRTFVVTAAVIAAAVVIFGVRHQPPVVTITGVGAAIAVAVALGVPFGWYYDHLIRRRTARFLAEQLGPGPYSCSIEIQTDSLRVAQSSLAHVFPWSSATEVDDTPEGVVVAFKSGRVLARTRGFTSLEHRQHFLRRVRELVAAATAENPSASTPTA